MIRLGLRQTVWSSLCVLAQVLAPSPALAAHAFGVVDDYRECSLALKFELQAESLVGDWSSNDVDGLVALTLSELDLKLDYTFWMWDFRLHPDPTGRVGSRDFCTGRAGDDLMPLTVETKEIGRQLFTSIRVGDEQGDVLSLNEPMWDTTEFVGHLHQPVPDLQRDLASSVVKLLQQDERVRVWTFLRLRVPLGFGASHAIESPLGEAALHLPFAGFSRLARSRYRVDCLDEASVQDVYMKGAGDAGYYSWDGRRVRGLAADVDESDLTVLREVANRRAAWRPRYGWIHLEEYRGTDRSLD